MKWDDFLRRFQGEPLIESSWLLPLEESPGVVATQLSRWVGAGKLIQLRRGLYTIAEPFVRNEPHPFYTANRLVEASYVSLQSALAHHGLIPEAVPVTTSVTTNRPRRCETPAGRFVFRHIRRGLFFGYEPFQIVSGQSVFLATPEKALLDLVHLTAGGDRREYLESLRLQNTEDLDWDRMRSYARRASSTKLERAAENLRDLLENETWVTL